MHDPQLACLRPQARGDAILQASEPSGAAEIDRLILAAADGSEVRVQGGAGAEQGGA